MYEEKLPNLRWTGAKTPVKCSKPGCNSDQFRTSLGVGCLFWWGGNGNRVVLDEPEGTVVETSVWCVHCKREHNPVVDDPPMSSQNLQDR